MLSPHFAFGVVADVQFADIPDGASFAGTPRHYRSSLTALERGVAVWQNQNLAFLLQLGDIIGTLPRVDHSVASAPVHILARTTQMGMLAMLLIRPSTAYCNA